MRMVGVDQLNLLKANNLVLVVTRSAECKIRLVAHRQALVRVKPCHNSTALNTVKMQLSHLVQVPPSKLGVLAQQPIVKVNKVGWFLLSLSIRVNRRLVGIISMVGLEATSGVNRVLKALVTAGMDLMHSDHTEVMAVVEDGTTNVGIFGLKPTNWASTFVYHGHCF